MALIKDKISLTASEKGDYPLRGERLLQKSEPALESRSNEPAEDAEEIAAGHDQELYLTLCAYAQEFGGLDRTAAEATITLFRAHDALFGALSKHFEEHHLSEAKFNVLMLLRRTENHEMPLCRIGEQLGVTRTNITKLIDGLEQHRPPLVRRVDHPEDRRSVLAQLTPEGLQVLQDILPHHWQELSSMWSGLDDDERITLVRLLNKFRRTMPGRRLPFLAVPCAAE